MLLCHFFPPNVLPPCVCVCVCVFVCLCVCVRYCLCYFSTLSPIFIFYFLYAKCDAQLNFFFIAENSSIYIFVTFYVLKMYKHLFWMLLKIILLPPYVSLFHGNYYFFFKLEIYRKFSYYTPLLHFVFNFFLFFLDVL